MPYIQRDSSIEKGRRTQFPLRLAYAMTVWKAQGDTLELAVVDIGTRETAGLSFVALSRVKHILNLAVIPFDFKRAKKISKSENLKLRKLEEARLNALANATTF